MTTETRRRVPFLALVVLALLLVGSAGAASAPGRAPTGPAGPVGNPGRARAPEQTQRPLPTVVAPTAPPPDGDLQEPAVLPVPRTVEAGATTAPALPAVTPIDQVAPTPTLPVTATAVLSDATATPAIRAMTAFRAHLRSSAERRRDNSIAEIPIHTDVDVYEMALNTSRDRLGGFWYRLRAYPTDQAPVDGWMHSTVIHLVAEQLQQLMGHTPDVVATPTAAPTVAALQLEPGDVVELPPQSVSFAQGAPAPIPEVRISLVWQICSDQNGSKTCDAGEGVRNTLVVVSETGTRRAEALVDADGLARLEFSAPQGSQLLISAPSIPVVQQAEARGGRVTLPAVVLPAVAQPFPLP